MLVFLREYLLPDFFFCQDKNWEAFPPFLENFFLIPTGKYPGAPVRPGRTAVERL